MRSVAGPGPFAGPYARGRGRLISQAGLREARSLTPGIFVRREGEAAGLLADPLFRGRWQELHRQCPWATVLQDVPYLTTWYELYSKQYEPVVVDGRDSSGGLMGLLCLGRERRSG